MHTTPQFSSPHLLTSIAIMESGNAVGPPYNGTDWYQPMYDQIVNATKYALSFPNRQYPNH